MNRIPALCGAVAALLVPTCGLAAQPATSTRPADFQAFLDRAQGAYQAGDFALASARADSALRLILPLDDPLSEIRARLMFTAAQIALGPPAGYRAAGFAMDSAAAAVERARRRARTPGERLAVLEQQSLVMNYWVRGIATRGGLGDFPVDDAFYAMLAAADRGRARVLADIVGATDRQAVTPADLVPDGRRLHAIAASTDASIVSYLATATRLLIWFSGPDGSLDLASADITDSALTELVLQARAALGVDNAADRSVRAMADALEADRSLHPTRAGGGDSTALQRLADILLPSRIVAKIGKAGRRDVVIIPHGAVAMVPFAALPIGSEIHAGGEILAYRYAPSLAVLEAVERRSKAMVPDTATLHGALIVGDPVMPRVGATRLAPLAGAHREAEWVAKRIGARLIAGAGATERVVRTSLATAPLVHLATHGFAYADPLREGDSFVALASDPTDDGLLTVYELEGMGHAISADLVVLSACQTGLGNSRLSEGTIGLPRAFLGAGARTVLASLWSVNDEATALLMQRFYQYWLEGAGQRTKAEALWRAQNDVRAVPRFAHPRYWAAFQLVGGN